MRRSPIEREQKRPEKVWKMKSRPQGWDGVDVNAEENPNRLHIDPAMIPEDMDLIWVTHEIFGKEFPEHRSKREKMGWAAVHQEDFDGLFDGKWMPKGKQGEIRMGDAVLMARPLELSQKSKIKEKFDAARQVADKTQGLINGDMPGVTLDPTHRSARLFNHVNREYEPIMLPDD